MFASLPPTLKRWISFTFILSVIVYLYGCQYMKVDRHTDDYYPTIKEIGTIHKHFVIHAGQNTYQLNNIEVDSLQMSGEISLVTNAIFYQEDRPKYIPAKEKSILNEIHVYLREDIIELPLGQAEFPYGDIKEIRIIENNTGKTIGVFFLTTLGVMVIVSIIVALTKSSCPYLYTYDGEAFIFEGELFGGSIGQNLQREDFLPLPSAQNINNEYKLRISNELKERQYTDLAELMVVNHPKDEKILVDANGTLHTIKDLQLPKIATSTSGEDLLETVGATDHMTYFFNDEDFIINQSQLTFPKPSGANHAKLVLNAKNTLWFDYLFGEFLKKFGGSYQSWMEKQSQVLPKERMQKMIDHHFPLSIYIKKDGQWELVEHILTIGPLASRDLVVPLDLVNVGNEVEIKMETGFMFWELDQVGIDFSDDREMKIEYVLPQHAFGTGKKNWTNSLNSIDQKYMVQENVGEVTEILFHVSEPPDDLVQSVFLHTSGYYELIREFSGLPKIRELHKFKDPLYFSEYSRMRYLQTLDRESHIASIKSLN